MRFLLSDYSIIDESASGPVVLVKKSLDYLTYSTVGGLNNSICYGISPTYIQPSQSISSGL